MHRRQRLGEHVCAILCGVFVDNTGALVLGIFTDLENTQIEVPMSLSIGVRVGHSVFHTFVVGQDCRRQEPCDVLVVVMPGRSSSLLLENLTIRKMYYN